MLSESWKVLKWFTVPEWSTATKPVRAEPHAFASRVCTNRIEKRQEMTAKEQSFHVIHPGLSEAFANKEAVQTPPRDDNSAHIEVDQRQHDYNPVDEESSRARRLYAAHKPSKVLLILVNLDFFQSAKGKQPNRAQRASAVAELLDAFDFASLGNGVGYDIAYFFYDTKGNIPALPDVAKLPNYDQGQPLAVVG